MTASPALLSASEVDTSPEKWRSAARRAGRAQRALLLALAAGLVASCGIGRTSLNEPLDALAVRSIEPGVSDAQDVVRLLGAPSDVVQLGRGSAYLYEAQETKVTGLLLIAFNMGHMDMRSDRVWVFLDEGDRVTHVGRSFATHRTRYALPWSTVHRPDMRERADRGRPGVGDEPQAADGPGADVD